MAQTLPHIITIIIQYAISIIRQPLKHRTIIYNEGELGVLSDLCTRGHKNHLRKHYEPTIHKRIYRFFHSLKDGDIFLGVFK